MSATWATKWQQIRGPRTGSVERSSDACRAQLGNHHAAGQVIQAVPCQESGQGGCHQRRSRLSGADHDDTRMAARWKSGDVREVEVQGEEHPSLTFRSDGDVIVVGAAQALVQNCVDVMAMADEERTQPLTQVLVELEPHASAWGSGNGSNSSVAKAAPYPRAALMASGLREG